MKNEKVEVSGKTIYQLLIAEGRYACTRANGLANNTLLWHLQEVYPQLSTEWKAMISNQLLNECLPTLIAYDEAGILKKQDNTNEYFKNVKEDDFRTWLTIVAFIRPYCDKDPITPQGKDFMKKYEKVLDYRIPE